MIAVSLLRKKDLDFDSKILNLKYKTREVKTKSVKNIKTNTLVSTGQHDVGSTTDMAINLSENIKGAKYIEIKNGKHLCNIECAKEFNKIIELFVDQNYDEA